MFANVRFCYANELIATYNHESLRNMSIEHSNVSCKKTYFRHFQHGKGHLPPPPPLIAYVVTTRNHIIELFKMLEHWGAEILTLIERCQCDVKHSI